MNASNHHRSNLLMHAVDKTNADCCTPNIKMNNRKIKFMIDSDNEISASPMKNSANLPLQLKLNKTSVSLRAYNNTKI